MREWTLRERELDFADAAIVFADRHTVLPDDRFEYGEARFISAGYLCGRRSSSFLLREEMRVTLFR
jgi:uncharacterized DUF497 family protein